MKNLRALLGLFTISFLAVIITGLVLNFLGIEHGSLLVKVGFIFIIVNIVLYLLILIFFVIKNLFQVYSEKKRKAIGSKFRTKLIASFLGLVLTPSILLFILSHQLINNSIDTWLSLEIQKPIYDSMDIARILYFKERQHAEDYAELLAAASNLSEETLQEITANSHYKSYFLRLPDASLLIIQAFQGIAGTDVLAGKEGDTIKAATPVIRNNKIIGVIVVESFMPADIVSKMEAIQKAFNDYVQIKTQQQPIRFLYFLMLTLATLLIIFLALWISLRIAKGITVPIQSLAEATNAVAHGNLDIRLQLQRDDEIGLLITSFNNMLDDIQQGKQSLEKAYIESDRRRLSMEMILESITTGVIFFDRTGRVTTMNNAACFMLDIEREDIEGESHKKLLQRLQSDGLSSMVKRLTAKGFGSVESELHLYISGRPMDLRVYMAAIMDASQKFVGTLVVFDNLTEIIMAQRALAWQEVAKRIAHEIKNPLTPIRLSAERLLKKWRENAQDFDVVIERATKTIVKEVDSLRDLVDEFSRFGKMPKIKLETTSIKYIIDEICELYRDLKDVKIISDIGDLPNIDIDKKQIRMALINLIDNAVQAHTKTIWINAIHNSSLDLIRIEIRDNGTGIPEEDKNKLFFPYFSTKKEGTGLGLAIVNSIISKHRGYIRVQDNLPAGTTFVIELPIVNK
ncbi:MAG: HAMP domain-containing protein [Nitrospira sp.]|nr:HAMP domain-containing protein [bacterium]MBL7049780.1 HAMP domain-containing protein [Nitrospira sp.]